MAAIADEPAPRGAFAASTRTGRRSPLAVLVDAWRVATTPGRPMLMRAQALAFVLVAAVAVASLGTRGRGRGREPADARRHAPAGTERTAEPQPGTQPAAVDAADDPRRRRPRRTTPARSRPRHPKARTAPAAHRRHARRPPVTTMRTRPQSRARPSSPERPSNPARPSSPATTRRARARARGQAQARVPATTAPTTTDWHPASSSRLGGVIVVIGAVEARAAEGQGMAAIPAGLASGIALAAAGAGARVEVVTRLGEDGAGDALLLAFAAAQVGHVATLRDAAHATPIVRAADEPIDPDAADEADVASSVDGPRMHPAGPSSRPPTWRSPCATCPTTGSSSWSTRPRPGSSARSWRPLTGPAPISWSSPRRTARLPDGLPDGSVLLAADPDADAVASIVGRYAAAVDGGDDPADAFRTTLGAVAADRLEPELALGRSLGGGGGDERLDELRVHRCARC